WSTYRGECAGVCGADTVPDWFAGLSLPARLHVPRAPADQMGGLRSLCGPGRLCSIPGHCESLPPTKGAELVSSRGSDSNYCDRWSAAFHPYLNCHRSPALATL